MKKHILLSCAILSLSACKTAEGLLADVDSWDLPSALSMSESSPEGLVLNGNCPAVEVMPELSSYSDFADDSSTRDNLLVSRARITNVQTACDFDKNSVTVDLKTRFEGTLGPQGRMSASDKPYFSYPFFVAVADGSGHVLTKEVYAAAITYPQGKNQHGYNENMRFILPMENRNQGRNQKILLGFQLTPDQLAFNRKQLKAEKEYAEQQKNIVQQKAAAMQPAAGPEAGTAAAAPAPLKKPQNLVIDAQPLSEQKPSPYAGH